MRPVVTRVAESGGATLTCALLRGANVTWIGELPLRDGISGMPSLHDAMDLISEISRALDESRGVILRMLPSPRRRGVFGGEGPRQGEAAGKRPRPGGAPRPSIGGRGGKGALAEGWNLGNGLLSMMPWI